MSHDPAARARRAAARFRPAVCELEGRALLSTMAVEPPGRQAAAVMASRAPSQASVAAIGQIYLNVLGRVPTAAESTAGARALDRGGAAATRAVAALLTGAEYRTGTIQSIYQQNLGRGPTNDELHAALRVFRRTGSSRQVEVSVLSSPAFFAQAGGTNAGYVAALFARVLGRSPGAAATDWVRRLNHGAPRSAAAAAVLNSPDALAGAANDLTGRYLYASATPQQLGSLARSLAHGVSPERLTLNLLNSREYRAAVANVGSSVLSVAATTPGFSTLAAAVQAADLAGVLSGPGPFTVFAPTDAAFAKLPPGTLQSLLADPARLRELLLYHVAPGVLPGPAVAGKGLVTTAQGQDVGVTGGQAGAPLTVGGANVVATVRAGNGVIHVIDTVLTIPDQTVAGLAANTPGFSTLFAAVQAAGLGGVLSGPGPFTVFAPTDAAFAKLPPGTLQSLLADPARLREVLLYHVVSGRFSASALAAQGTLTTALGASVVAQDLGGSFVINSSNVILPNVVASNGVIQAIDTVLLPPTM